MRITAFRALRPRPDVASQVACAPYDTVDADEARDLIADNPASFLRVIRPEVNFDDDMDPYAREVYAKARETLDRFEKEGLLQREDEASLYVYRLKMGSHEQSGVVTCCHIEDYEQHLVKRHENTLADKEFDRMRMLDAMNAQTGPVFLMYRDAPDIDALVAACKREEPLVRFTAGDGVEHTVWRARDPAAFVNAFAAVPASYVADGHHRAAAAVRVGVECREGNAEHTGVEDYNWFLSVLFPSSQLRIFPYNRLVRDLNGLSRHAFLSAVKERCVVDEDGAPEPSQPRSVSMYVGGKWYGLSWQADADSARQPSLMGARGGAADPVSALDVTFLHEQILGPVLGVWDTRSEPRISFVGGIKGPEELARRVDSVPSAVAFSMYPVTVDQVMDVADAGRNMPPKSTWFEPKLRSGLFVHTF